MYTIEGKIKFISDVLFNKPTEGALASTESGQRGKKKTVEQKLAEIPEMLHRNGDGSTIVVYSLAFKKSYISGASFAGLKIGKKSIFPFLNALTFPEDLSFGVSEPEFIHKTWGRIPPRTGSLVIIRRPGFRAGRELPFKILVADNMIEPDQIKIAIEHGGLIEGVGSYRPIYGRYQLTEFRAIK